MKNKDVNAVLSKVVGVKNFTHVINISTDVFAVIYPKRLKYKNNMFQLNFVNVAEEKLLKQPGSEFIQGLYGENLSRLFEAIAKFTRLLEEADAQYHLYRIKSKKELNKIPNIKDFWYYNTPNKILFKLRPANNFSNDLLEVSRVHRSDTDLFFVTPDGNVVHKDAVELVG